MAKGKTKRSTDKRQNKEIKKLKKDVKMLMAPLERKFLDVAMDGPVAGNSDVVILNNVGRVIQDGTVPNQNASMSQRVGKAIHMTRIRIKGFVSIVSPSLAAVPTPGYEDFIGRVRILLVRWHQYDASAISTPDDFLTAAAYPSTYSGEDAFIDGFKKKYPENNYDVLYDRVVNLQSPEQATASPVGGTANIVPVFAPRARVNIDLKLKHDANWAQIEETASPSQNSIAMYLIGGNGAPVTSTARFFKLLNSRLDFLDA